jgi:general secretion pathway protein B
MSLILEALKKLDREKSSRRTRTANIAVEILRPDLPHPGKRIPLYFVAISLTAVAAAAITYAVVTQFGSPSKPSPPASVYAPAPTQQVVPASPSSPSRETIRDARDEVSRVPPKVQGHARSKSPVAPLSEKKESPKVIPEEADAPPADIKKPVERTPDGSAPTPPSLTVSGIIWSEEPSKRFAVINGTVATEGSVIHGVKVVEIHPTHVILSHKGQSFEISLFK